MVYFRSPYRPVTLAVADLFWGLPTGGILRGTEKLLIYCPGCNRSPLNIFSLFCLQRSNQAVVLYESILQRDLETVVSVSLYAAEHQEGFQSVALFSLHIKEPLGGLQTLGCVVKLSCV